jgi:hypothetical protein
MREIIFHGLIGPPVVLFMMKPCEKAYVHTKGWVLNKNIGSVALATSFSEFPNKVITDLIKNWDKCSHCIVIDALLQIRLSPFKPVNSINTNHINWFIKKDTACVDLNSRRVPNACFYKNGTNGGNLLTETELRQPFRSYLYNTTFWEEPIA